MDRKVSDPEQQALQGSVVKVKGLPYKASVQDIRTFFRAFSVRPDGIVLKLHPDGRPNGEAFVVFDSPVEAVRACSRDRCTFSERFGDRYVRVYPAQPADLAQLSQLLWASLASDRPAGVTVADSGDSVVKVKSLPLEASQLDVLRFFQGFRLRPNGVQLVIQGNQKPTGEAYVDFESADEAAHAVAVKDRTVFSQKFGDRYVRLMQVPRIEMQQALALRYGGEGIIKMRGLPFKATAADVVAFFAPCRTKSDGIAFIMHADGRPSGMAFVEFETPQEALTALAKDRHNFGAEYGDRFCLLQLVGRHEMAKANIRREEVLPAHQQSGGVPTHLMSSLSAAMLQNAMLSNTLSQLAGTYGSQRPPSHLAHYAAAAEPSSVQGLPGLNALPLPLQGPLLPSWLSLLGRASGEAPPGLTGWPGPLDTSSLPYLPRLPSPNAWPDIGLGLGNSQQQQPQQQLFQLPQYQSLPSHLQQAVAATAVNSLDTPLLAHQLGGHGGSLPADPARGWLASTLPHVERAPGPAAATQHRAGTPLLQSSAMGQLIPPEMRSMVDEASGQAGSPKYHSHRLAGM